MGQIIDILALCLNAPLFCDTDQFLRILYLVVSIWRNGVKSMADLSSMVRMGSSSAGGKTKEVSSCDSVSVTSADTSGCFLCDTAGSHSTDTAANTFLSEFTVGSLILNTCLPGICAYFCSCLQKSLGCGFEFFDSRKSECTHINLLCLLDNNCLSIL